MTQTIGLPETMAEWALWYAHLGWPVFPLHSVLLANGAPIGCSCGTQSCREEPKRRGKHPRTKNGVKNATLDARVIREWWSQWPDANIGVSTDGLIVLDIDPMKNGDVSLLALIEEVGRIPHTVTSETGSGGHHYVFRGSRGNGTGLRPGVDVKSAGGYIVVPPSNHWTGGGYSWVPGQGPADIAPAYAPEWLLSLAKAKPGRSHGPRLRVVEGGRGDSVGGVGYAAAAMRSALESVRYAPDGERNDTLNREVYGMAGLVATGALREVDVRSSFEVAGLAAGLTDGEVVATIDSAMKAGLAAPREVPMPGAASADAHGGADDANGAGTAGKAWVNAQSGDVGSERVEIELILDDSRRPEKIAENVARVLVLYPGGPPRWDEFAGCPIWPGGRGLDASDREEIQGWLYQQPQELRVRASAEVVEAGIRLAARRDRFHPVKGWLSSLRWDGVGRVDRLWEQYFGCAHESWLAWSARAFLLGAVARVLDPGCKVDTMPIIEGPQGAFKSSALEALCGSQWFTSARIDMRSKDSFMLLDGKWIFEVREFEKLSKPGAEAELKAFIDAATDRYRRPWGRHVEDVPRQCVFAGTTNRDDYLPDPTGRRRFHPIRCGRIALDALRADREQIWAESYARAVAGEQRYLPAEVEAQVEVVAEGADADDPWRAAILLWLIERGNPEIVTAHEVLRGIGVDVGRHDGPAARRVGESLAKEGYRRGRNKHHKYWTRG